MAPATPPPDQAHGLRRLFAAAPDARAAARPAPPWPVALLHNPHVGFGGAVMERLCAAFGAAGHPTLVVDAADTATEPAEVARVDLRAAIEPLAGDVAYLAARGLPMRWLDARASTEGFVDALLQAAAPGAAVLVHASAADLRRMFGGRLPRPVLVASAAPAALTAAYAAIKRLTERLGPLTFDAVVVDGTARGAERAAERLADCADRFLGAALGHWARLDALAAPRRAGDDREAPAFAAIVEAQLAHARLPAPRRPPRHLDAVALPTLPLADAAWPAAAARPIASIAPISPLPPTTARRDAAAARERRFPGA